MTFKTVGMKFLVLYTFDFTDFKFCGLPYPWNKNEIKCPTNKHDITAPTEPMTELLKYLLKKVSAEVCDITSPVGPQSVIWFRALNSIRSCSCVDAPQVRASRIHGPSRKWGSVPSSWSRSDSRVSKDDPACLGKQDEQIRKIYLNTSPC